MDGIALLCSYYPDHAKVDAVRLSPLEAIQFSQLIPGKMKSPETISALALINTAYTGTHSSLLFFVFFWLRIHTINTDLQGNLEKNEFTCTISEYISIPEHPSSRGSRAHVLLLHLLACNPHHPGRMSCAA